MIIGCPIAVEGQAQAEALPQGGSDQGEEAGEAVVPLTEAGAEALQEIFIILDAQRNRPTCHSTKP